MLEEWIEELFRTEAGVGLLVTYTLAGGALLRFVAGLPARVLDARASRRREG